MFFKGGLFMEFRGRFDDIVEEAGNLVDYFSPYFFIL